MQIPVLTRRILGEEKVLREDLPGYTDYLQRVRYRLMPRLWYRGESEALW